MASVLASLAPCHPVFDLLVYFYVDHRRLKLVAVSGHALLLARQTRCTFSQPKASEVEVVLHIFETSWLAHQAEITSHQVLLTAKLVWVET